MRNKSPPCSSICTAVGIGDTMRCLQIGLANGLVPLLGKRFAVEMLRLAVNGRTSAPRVAVPVKF